MKPQNVLAIAPNAAGPAPTRRRSHSHVPAKRHGYATTSSTAKARSSGSAR